MSRIEFVHSDDEHSLIAELQKQGVRVFRLDGAKVFDKTSFFQQVAVDIPACSQGWYARNWDGFDDNFGAELRDEQWQKAVFLWSRAENVLEGGLEVLIQMVQIIDGFSSDIKTRPERYKPLAEIRLVLTGQGRNFESLHK